MKNFLLITALIIITSPLLVFAQGYTPLVGIPGVSNPNTDFNTYINTIYALSISIAALLAVIKIVIAGVKWMMTDIVTSKGEAKKDIQGAVLGLLLILGAVLIIEVINPDINDVNLTFDPIGIPKYSRTVTSKPAIPRQLGDDVFDFEQAGIKTEAEKKLECENITSECGNIVSSKASCYRGTYYGRGQCLVKASELKAPSFKCDPTSTTIDPATGSSVQLYNCNRAVESCKNAGGTAGSRDETSFSVNCTYQ